MRSTGSSTSRTRGPRAAVLGPRLLNPDGTLQRSVRGFPTLWRLATEYLFLRKLAPRTSALNAFYAGGFDHDEVREAEVVMGSCMLVRRAAIDDVGASRRGVLPLQRGDRLVPVPADRLAGRVLPGRECVHVGGAAHGGRMYRENVRGHLRFLRKHEGARTAERARKLLLARRCGCVECSFAAGAAASYRDVAGWLGSGATSTRSCAMSGVDAVRPARGRRW